jgi:hypothetical protein
MEANNFTQAKSSFYTPPSSAILENCWEVMINATADLTTLNNHLLIHYYMR